MRNIHGSPYEDTLNEIVFSFSTLHQYEQCPYAFYMKKIDQTEDDEGNYYAEVGSFVHDIHAQLLEGTLKIDDVLDYYMDNYSNNVVYETHQATMDKKYMGGLDYFAALDLSSLSKYEVLGVEKKVNFRIDKYKFVGFIDFLLRHKESGRIILVDHKSSDHFLKKDGTPLKNQKENFEAYSRQMYLYSKAVYDEYGQFPDRIVWNHFFENQITNIPFNERDYEHALKWAFDTITHIYHDREFLPKENYMMCNVICGYRNTCCYANEEGDENQ